jgi:hypothetical protein
MYIFEKYRTSSKHTERGFMNGNQCPHGKRPKFNLDDEELHLRTHKSILEGKGHSAMVSETGAAAIEKVLN